MTKRRPKLQIIRFVTQIIFLIALTGLFTLTFSQIGQVYSMIINGKFNFIQSFPRLIAAITVIPITILLGRFFCGWMCAFGTFNDLMYITFKKIFRIKFTIDKKIDSILKYLKYVILLFIVCFIWTKSNSSLNQYSPWNAFAQITNFPEAIVQYIIGFIILAFIALGAIFVERFFCRYLCPLGAIFTIISKVRIFKIKKPTDKCGKCRLCTNKCSMGIELYKMDKVSSGECINCLKCIEVCPRENPQANILGEDINSTLASAIAVAAFTGIYATNSAISGFVNKNNTSIGVVQTNNTVSASTNATLQGNYKDGTYTGVGHGFGPNLKVQITIKNNKITNIEIVSHNESSGYYEEPFNVVPKEIIQDQSTNVDAVSGATRSSNGIMMAVEDALSQAKTESGATDSSSSASDNSSTNNTAAESNATDQSSSVAATAENSNTSKQTKYKDGTYTGVGSGFRPDLNVSVTVKNDKITNIEIVSHHESRGYYEEPFNVVPKEIIQSQSTNVDAVSGATRSSDGIMMAVEDALSKAKI